MAASKCYARLQVIDIISNSPDAESFGKLMFKLVSYFVYKLFGGMKFWILFLFLFDRDTADCPSALGILVKHSSLLTLTLVFSRMLSQKHPVMLIFNNTFPMPLHFYWICRCWSRGKWKFLVAGTTIWLIWQYLGDRGWSNHYWWMSWGMRKTNGLY